METEAPSQPLDTSQTDRSRWAAAGGIAGAILASSCCVIPLLLFSVGVSGAWISNLTALEPYKPVFILMALGFVGYGFRQVYWKPDECDEGTACARPLPNRLVKTSLWASLVLIVIAMLWTWIAPIVAPIILGL